MAIGVLGRPHRVSYVSRNFLTGLTDVKAYVLLPNLTRVGPFSLTESADPKFVGYYFFSFPTLVSDAPGEYIGIVESPSEPVPGVAFRRTQFKIEYPGGVKILNEINNKTVNLPGDPASNTVVCQKHDSIINELSDVVRISDLSNISGVFNFYSRMSTVYKDDTDTHEIMCWLERNNTRLLDTSNCRIEFHNADGTLVWQATATNPNADGFFLVSAPSISLEKDKNFYVLIEIEDGDNIDHLTTLPTVTVG